MQPTALETLHLMVVDDEPDMRVAVERTLVDFVHHEKESGTSVGFHVIHAGSAEHAFALAETAKPDIMLLDHGLPGMSGIDLLQRIREAELEIIVIVITAYGTLENAVRATKLGAFDFLAKPFTPDELRSVVCKAVDHVTLQRQTRRIAEERRKIRFEFLTVLVHELKAPLSAVEGYLRILQEPGQVEAPENRRRMVDRSLVRLEGMRKLIYDLLDLTRIESGQKKRLLTQVDVAKIAAKAVETITPAAAVMGLTVNLHGASSLEMLADAEEVEIIINNLLSNAVKYNRPEGRVDITCERRDETAVISVTDTGIGMTADETGRLFREFSRIRSSKTAGVPGSGLGLSIIKRLADLYDGSVEVESRPDVGSTFTVALVDKKTFVDNEYYDREASTWWSDTESPLLIIRNMLNPVRFAYVIKRLVEQSFDYRGRRVLDIGCGGGFLTEQIARFGFDTTGVDPSAPSLVTARSHAKALNLHIDYQEGVGEALLFPDNHFDIVFCLDVLEHVTDFRKIIAEVSRVLVPGGYFFFETVNRTALSYLVAVFLMQTFPLTRVMPRDIHNWKYFIKPAELRRALLAENMSLEDVTGVLPGFNLAHILPSLRKMAAGRISLLGLCSICRCHESRVKGLCYVGYARKAPAER
ncbi:MAG: 3-demethylubiquinone-9 3-O-methyltransferase [Spirochaetaceae bacterium]|nr:MAG: 3-demethylubiquinone-9 3-O-methyltransferase [Spirochaetaceae bacterium]